MFGFYCCHVFHGRCIRPILLTDRPRCPLCRVMIQGTLPLFLELAPQSSSNKTIENDLVASVESATAALSFSENAAVLYQNMGAAREQTQQLEGRVEELEEQIIQLSEQNLHYEELLAESQRRLRCALGRAHKARDQAEQRTATIHRQLYQLCEERDALRVQCQTLKEQLEELRRVRIARDLQAILLEMSEAQVGEQLAGEMAMKTREDLEMMAMMLVMRSRSQQRDMEEAKEATRRARLETEALRRQLCKMRFDSPKPKDEFNNQKSGAQGKSQLHQFSPPKSEKDLMPMSIADSIENIPMTSADNDLGRKLSEMFTLITPVNTFKMASLSSPPSSSIPSVPDKASPLLSTATDSVHLLTPKCPLSIPPKFTPTKWQSKGPDGCGGSKRIYYQPKDHPS